MVECEPKSLKDVQLPWKIYENLTDNYATFQTKISRCCSPLTAFLIRLYCRTKDFLGHDQYLNRFTSKSAECRTKKYQRKIYCMPASTACKQYLSSFSL